MNKYSKSQIKVLVDFFTGISVAWFATGLITPQFSRIASNDKISYTLFGFIGGYLFLYLALEVTKILDKNGK